MVVLPVDPMAWSTGVRNGTGEPRDVLLSVSEDGELAFWALEEDFAAAAGGAGGVEQEGKGGQKECGDGASEWKCTGRVRTGRRGIGRARCSSAKKSALGAFSFYFSLNVDDTEALTNSDGFLLGWIGYVQSCRARRARSSRSGTRRSRNSLRGWSISPSLGIPLPSV